MEKMLVNVFLQMKQGCLGIILQYPRNKTKEVYNQEKWLLVNWCYYL